MSQKPEEDSSSKQRKRSKETSPKKSVSRSDRQPPQGAEQANGPGSTQSVGKEVEAKPVNQKPEKTTTSPTAVERAEQFWSDVGRSLQTIAQRASQQTQQTTSALQKKLNETAQSSPEAQEQEPAQPPMEKADQLVHNMEQRLAQWTSAANLQIRRTGSRMREEAEDLLAEARNLRNQAH